MSNKLHLIALCLAFFGIALTANLILSQNALAQSNGGGVGGSGGTNTGWCQTHDCSSLPNTDNGYGWYAFGVNDPGPADLRSGDSWQGVVDTCRNSGNDSIIAFIVLRPVGDVTNSRVYNYVAGDFGTYFDYRGNNGGNWLTYAQAQGKFDSLPSGLKVGYTWGSNVAWFCFNSARQWNVSGNSFIQNNGMTANINLSGKATVNAKPGDKLFWYHNLYNNGPNDMDRQIYHNIQKTGFSNGWDAQSQPSGFVGPARANSFVVTQYATNGAAYATYTVAQADVGNTLCQRINWQAVAWNNPSAASSNFACAYVPYSYALVPEVTNISDGGTIESGVGDIPLSGRVTNTGLTRSQPNIQWQLTQIKFAPGVAFNKTGGVSVGNPCTYFTGEFKCDVTTSGSGVEAVGYGRNETKAYNSTGSPGDEVAGTKLCYSMSIKRNSSTSSDWRHSDLHCLVVAKKPKVQVLGGDLVVGQTAGVVSDVITSVSRTSSGTTYGSWTEYGIIPTGKILGMASGAGYVNGSVITSLCSLSVLSFANSDGSACKDNNIGGYTKSAPAPNIAARFPTSTTTPNLTQPPSGKVTLGSLSGLYKSNAAMLTLSGGTIPMDRWVVINAPDTTVIISDSINYAPGAITSIGSIPQLVIIAKNIIISDVVTNIDSWLIASGNGVEGAINTCGAGTGITETSLLTTTICKNKLTVNGPIVANHLIMRRTAGAGPAAQSGEPAEVFNLRADAYLWATAYSKSDGVRLPTVSTKEVPPRF